MKWADFCIISITIIFSILLEGCSLRESRDPFDPAFAAASALNPRQSLGKEIFFDTSLSEPAGQACGSCHDPSVAFTTPKNRMSSGITPGVISSRSGMRNAPTASYAAFSPIPFFDGEAGTWVGGQFLDQRADDLEEQAGGPPLNGVEMANPSKAAVVAKLRAAPYASRFRTIFGADIFDDTERAYRSMTQLIADYQRSSEVSPFSSKYDAYLSNRALLTAQELKGLSLFRDPAKGNCEACHPSRGDAPLFTDFTNDNIGVMKNPTNPFYAMPVGINPDGALFIDRGLGGSPKINDSQFDGRFKVPTLRNVARTFPYMHNGVFQDLRDVVRFYNTVCAPGNPDGWDPPEVAETQNCSELGDLHLADDEIDAIVAFLRTLNDGYIQR